MSGATEELVLQCWSRIGVWGDRSCVELSGVGHCRNCNVYSAGGNELLARAAPDDYIDFWTALLASKKESTSAAVTTYLAFRAGESWLAMKALLLREIVLPGAIRSIPHKRSEVLLGITAVRGEIYPCVSLHKLIGEPSMDSFSARGVRFLVASHQGKDWVFPIDEVSGIYDIVNGSVEPLPATIAHGGSIYTMGITQCGDRPVGLIDDELLFSTLQRRIG